jgi:hypothetical protein
VAVAALAAVGVVAVVGPGLSLHADAPAGDPLRSQRSQEPDHSVREPSLRWPLRGDLAADDAFVASAMRRLTRVRPASTRALFAGRLPDGSRLLLAGGGPRPALRATSVSAVYIGAGQSITTGTVSQAAVLDAAAQTLGWAGVGVSGNVFSIALGAPRPLRVQLSPRVDFDHDGSPSRRWQTAASDDGVAIADLGTQVDPWVAVRSLANATFMTPVLMPVTGRPGTPADAVRVDGLASAGYHGPRPAAVRQALSAVTETLLDLGTTTQRVVWSGVPWAQRPFALVLITRADGVRIEVLIGQQGSGWFPAGLRALARDDPDDLPWVLEPFSAQDPTQLLCPTGGGHVVYRHNGRTVRLRVRDDGVVSLVDPGPSAPSTGGARITLYGPTGKRLLSTALPKTGERGEVVGFPT